MYIDPLNVRVPIQTPYAFIDGELHSDPSALTHFLGSETKPLRDAHFSCMDRSFEKARRVRRMAVSAGKERLRRQLKGRGA